MDYHTKFHHHRLKLINLRWVTHGADKMDW